MPEAREKILIIDDNITNLDIVRKSLEGRYDVVLMPSGEKALGILRKIKPDLILLDVEMPELDGFQVIEKIKKMPAPICNIPVIFLTAKNDNSSEFEGLNLGAVDYISKPFSFPLLLKRVELHLELDRQKRELLNYSTNLEQMVVAKTRVITELQYSVVHVLADMVERRDSATGGHLLRTSNYLKILLKKAVEEKVYKDKLENIDFELLVDCTNELRAIGDIMMASNPDIELCPGTVGQLGIMIFETSKKLEVALKIDNISLSV